MKSIQTYEDAVTYLKEYIPFTLYNTDAYKKTATHDPLDRMRYLLKLLDHPEKKFASVLIGGTSGKGSTSYLLSHILTTAGYKTGLTLSPHIVTINERIQLNGAYISNDEFTELVKMIHPIVEKMAHSPFGSPSYFEITVGMAFLFFAQKKVDIAVVEVGMGGEHDATNTLEPLIAILTNVSLDHTQFLGETVEEIARTKTGIIKKYIHGHSGIVYPEIFNFRDPESHTNKKILKQVQNDKGMIVITGVTQPSVIEILEKRCKEVGSAVYRLGKDFQLTKFEIGLPGEYQRENASLAIAAAKQLEKFGFSISENVIKTALKTGYFPGRFEIIKSPFGTFGTFDTSGTFVLDGAHNTAKMHAFVSSLQKKYPQQKKVFVISFKKDKHIDEMIKEILPIADTIIVTEFQIGTDTMISNASMSAEEVGNIIQKNSSRQARTIRRYLLVEKDSKKAIEKAISLCHSVRDTESKEMPDQVRHDTNCIIAITGSLYLVGEVKQNYFTDERK